MKRNCAVQKKTLSLLAALAVCTCLQTAAETFRVHETMVLPVNVTGAPAVVKPGINDAVIIALPEDRTFIQGIELSIKVPQIVASWHDSIAWSFYDDINPIPTEKYIDYSGTRSTLGTFNALSLNIQVPLSEKNTIKKSPYSFMVKNIPQEIDGKLFFRLQIAMKGVPEEISSEHFEITAKPILIDKGRLVLSVAAPAGDALLQPYTAFIDGKPFIPEKKGLVVDSGVHTLSIVSDFYRNEVRTVTIEQAKTTALLVTFRNITPLVVVTAPSDAVIYFDNEKIENTKEPFPVTQGDHTVRFVIGDYEVVKTVSAVNGRSYTVSVTVDAAVSESE